MTVRVPDLPYVCTDPSCECRVPSPYPQETISFGQDENGFWASVVNENGLCTDILRDHTLPALVGAVHRNYPHARKGRP